MGKNPSIYVRSFIIVLITSLVFFHPVSADTEYEYENEVFKIHSIHVKGPVIHIEGEARVFEGTVQYAVTESGELIKEGFTTATTYPVTILFGLLMVMGAAVVLIVRRRITI